MKRGYLAIGVALLLAVGLGLWALRPGAEEPAGPAQPAPSTPEVTGRSPAASPTRPRLDADPVTRPAVKEYMVGDVRVRDHRTGDHPEVDLPPPIHAPEGRRIPSSLTSDIVQQLRGATTGCGADLPADARGDKPRVDGTIAIAIKDHKATITSAAFQVRDVVGGLGDPIKRCFEQKAVGVTTPSGDEPDLAGYQISMQLRLP
jgi:hypothetical protein